MKIGAFTFPFFPMRPFTGARLFTEEAMDSALAMQATGDYVLQKKLNGDRGILGVQDGQVYLANRHGSFYKMTCNNKSAFSHLPNGTLIDGEVWKKNFYPFEVIQIGDNKLFAECNTQLRIDAAEQLCRECNVEWLFTPPTKEWMTEFFDTKETWEGVVCKAARCKYFPMASESSESPNWRRMKW